MIKKGFISTISGSNARVTFPDLDKSVTPSLSICPHVGALNIGDSVIVVFWNDNLSDGAIIGKVI